MEAKHKTKNPKDVGPEKGGGVVPEKGGAEDGPATGGEKCVPETGVVKDRPETSKGTGVASAKEKRSPSEVTVGPDKGGSRVPVKSTARVQSVSPDDVGTKTNAAQRGRGRPPSTWQYVGLAEAQRALNEAKKEELRLRAQKEVADLAAALKARSSPQTSGGPTTRPDGEVDSVPDLQDRIKTSLEVIEKVATRSGNLKGTFAKALKDAASTIAGAVDLLSRRTASEEVEQLRASNTKLQMELNDLRKEMDTLRKEQQSQGTLVNSVASSGVEELRKEIALLRQQQDRLCENERERAPPMSSSMACNTEELVHAVIGRVGPMISAHFEELEKRMQPAHQPRLPLDEEAGQSLRTEAIATTLMAPANPGPKMKTKAGKKKKKASSRTEQTVLPTNTESLIPNPNAQEGWNVVTKRSKKKKAAASQQSKKKVLPEKPKQPKIRPPRSAVVAIQLQPGAEERNISYGDVFTQIKQKIDLSELGIQDLRYKVAATGTRMLELPGANNEDKAEALAKRLCTILEGSEVHISRPIRCAELRLLGLDDSVTSKELAEVISQLGGCTKESVKVGEIRRNRFGLGSAWVKCPVLAAKKIADSKRIPVGLVTAQVRLLQPRTQRCFRCHEVGHVAAKCTGGDDRSSQCYRCGQPGHKRGSCANAPFCPVCNSANRPANHIIGSAACTRALARKKKGKHPIAGTNKPPKEGEPVNQQK